MLTSNFSSLRGTPSTNATSATHATAATSSLSWQTTSNHTAQPFAQVFSQLHAEVSRVIDQGWPSESALPALSAEGIYHRLQAPFAVSTDKGGSADMAASQQDFLTNIAPWAEEAAATLGVSPKLVAAHAALESGWGQRPLRDAAGRDSHNLFGIKAQPGWNGASVAALTTEYEDGAALQKTEGFRSYPDYASAFRDYAHLLQSNPRYSGALNTGTDAAAFAQALARGGYATDPSYAAKLTRMATQLQSLD
jgi:flagellar protein FlgJ